MWRREETKYQILPGRWSIEELDLLVRDSSAIEDVGERIEFLSRRFLGVAYKGSTLIGDIDRPEVLVIDLEGVDCLTLIEYIEAMRRSDSFTQFVENLRKVRYTGGYVSYERRKHFFTDWIQETKDSLPDSLKFIEDVTLKVGGSRTRRVYKRLNLKGDGSSILRGIPFKEREISYIPSRAVDETIVERLKTGDYAGIYSEEEGIDVSHVGIVIKSSDRVYLRHASSRADLRRVVDEEFRGYISGKPGLVIFRPR